MNFKLPDVITDIIVYAGSIEVLSHIWQHCEIKKYGFSQSSFVDAIAVIVLCYLLTAGLSIWRMKVKREEKNKE